MKTGQPPYWGPGAKSAAGTALGLESGVWFTMAKGCITETYYPRPDLAHTRWMFLVVTDEAGFFSDERFDTEHTTRLPEPGIPLFETENRCHNNRYRLVKRTFTDPFRDVLLQRVSFEPISDNERFRIWVFAAPGLGNEAYGNNASIEPSSNALVAARAQYAIALKASCGLSMLGCTFQDPDDPWHQLKSGRRVGGLPTRADDGNVLLVGELNYAHGATDFVLAIGYGDSSETAVRNASESLANDPEKIAGAYEQQWREYLNSYSGPTNTAAATRRQTSVAVLKTHQSKDPPGGMVASLAVPWGDAEQQIVDFRYQLAWTRDAVESASSFIAIGDLKSAQAAWHFLVQTQQEDGHWPQNMWLDGTPHWSGIQMDETAMPILLADLLRRHNGLCAKDSWPTVRRAAAYLVQHGPGTEEDRWEKDGGYSPYTLAVEVAGLLAAADIADLAGEGETGDYFRALADWWNDNIENWMFIDGHYVRLSSPEKNRLGEMVGTVVSKKSHSHSPAALALVRFGLRSATDPRMLSTVADMDRHLKSETATGPVWHRYPDDEYGEYEDGRPFDGHGRGRGWPLLTGERAHYEIARGNFDEAEELARAIEKQANECGLLPEQVWDSSDLPCHGLFSGRPSGSAMPLVWAHAEYLKLLRSLADRSVFDLPPQTVDRYLKRNIKAAYAIWTTDHKIAALPAGKILRVESRRPADVFWTLDHWKTVQSSSTKDSRLGPQYCDIPTADLKPGGSVGFTFCWEGHRWENRGYELAVTEH